MEVSGDLAVAMAVVPFPFGVAVQAALIIRPLQQVRAHHHRHQAAHLAAIQAINAITLARLAGLPVLPSRMPGALRTWH